jgi:hypothetical protein
MNGPGMVEHCYLGSGDREDHGWRLARAKSGTSSSTNKLHRKNIGRKIVVSGVRAKCRRPYVKNN